MDRQSECLIPHCKSRSDNPDIGFFCITKNRRESWMAAIGASVDTTGSRLVCSQHFLKNQLIRINGKMSLRDPFAVPSVNIKESQPKPVTVVQSRPGKNTQVAFHPKPRTPNCLIIVDPNSASKVMPIAKEDAARTIVPPTNKVLCTLDPKKGVTNLNVSTQAITSSPIVNKVVTRSSKKLLQHTISENTGNMFTTTPLKISQPTKSTQLVNTHPILGSLLTTSSVNYQAKQPSITSNIGNNVMINQNIPSTVPVLMVQPTQVIGEIKPNLNASRPIQRYRNSQNIPVLMVRPNQVSNAVQHNIAVTKEEKSKFNTKRKRLPKDTRQPNLKSMKQLRYQLKYYRGEYDRLKTILKKVRYTIGQLKRYNIIDDEVYFILLKSLKRDCHRRLISRKIHKYDKSVKKQVLTMSAFSKRTFPLIRKLFVFKTNR